MAIGNEGGGGESSGDSILVGFLREEEVVREREAVFALGLLGSKASSSSSDSSMISDGCAPPEELDWAPLLRIFARSAMLREGNPSKSSKIFVEGPALEIEELVLFTAAFPIGLGLGRGRETACPEDREVVAAAEEKSEMESWVFLLAGN